LNSFFSGEGTFARFMNLVWDLILISMLWFFLSLPVVTLGAASTAAYYAAAKVIRFHTGHIIPEFFRSFRLNFKQSTLFSMICILIFAILVFDCIYFYSTNSFLFSLFCLMMAMTLGCMLYFFPLLSRFHMRTFSLFRMAAVLMFRHLFTTILLLVLLISVFLAMYAAPWSVLVAPGAAALAWVYLMEPILRKCAPTPQEGSEESAKWYYQ